MKKVIVDKNELYKLYIEDNLSITEVSNIMNISYRTIQRAIKEYGFNKDKSQIQEQRKELLKEKYGVENTYQLDSSIEKIKQTKLEKYGDIMEKVKITITKEELYDLYINQNLRRADLANKLNISEGILKRLLKEYNIKKDISARYKLSQETKLKKYGNTCNMQIKEVIDKRNKIMLDKYGSVSAFNDESIYDKRNKTMLDRYGVKYIMQTEEGKSKLNWNSKKQRQTMLDKYGVDNGFKLVDKIENSKYEKYGSATYNNQTQFEETMLERYGVTRPVYVKEFQEKIKQTTLDRYGVEYACITKNCLNSQGYTVSKINKKISELFTENNIDNELEFSLINRSYDIHILNTNILIEINPTYTHNSTIPIWFHSFEKEPIDKNYHIKKTKLALENGYRCIHIWDWDDIDKIINILKPKEKIYARKCIIKEVSVADSDEFLNKYHLQNTCKGQAIKLGLYYNNELVEIMTFGKPRYNKKYEYELLRLCTCSNYIVIGGTEKLFKYFINNYKPKSIISYCDNSKFDGEVYRRLGFILKDFGSPSKHWFNGKRHITDNLLRQRGFDQLFNANYGKGTSNEELIINEGFVEVYDSGQSIYIKEF